MKFCTFEHVAWKGQGVGMEKPCEEAESHNLVAVRSIRYTSQNLFFLLEIFFNTVMEGEYERGQSDTGQSGCSLYYTVASDD